MRRKTLTPATLLTFGALALGASAVSGCSAFENLGGAKKVSPDEFKIVSHSPLTMPPNADLRPPRPGEPRPQEVAPSEQAKEALSPTLASRSQAQAGTGTNQPQRAGDASEQALVAKASAGGVDPNIRSTVNKDARTIADQDKTFIDSLIFWQKDQPVGTLVDPAKEQQRLRDAQASGQASSEPTPTIKRRQRGLLEGIF
ncbi:Beta-barrel assembly machine subunit BamF [Enhydrobacter aerosaccus]|uniref:Beta-barrel assembly machine subunit BamF n=1 Tax=Enhydrobacter aerosaccus TaxID=225324 RepID=A0A1T4SU88_9HYPH|nr:DUF3035 domain-containing protein [Enhydrobacter aerosaccus]SKA31825.1 Beta-barrel assembly machine subunit BamF [Enhydrobacter aerosaccus]